MSQAHQPLVPLADRPFATEEIQDSERQTIWFNPTDKVVVLDLHVGTPRPRKVNHGLPKGTPGGPMGWEEKNGKRRYTIAPSTRKAIPSEFDMAIQHTQCHHVDCLQAPFLCKSREEGHEKTIQGGFGPQLVNEGSQDAPIAKGFIQLSPALDDAQARKEAAEKAEYEAWRQKNMAEERELAAVAAKAKAEVEIEKREKNKNKTL